MISQPQPPKTDFFHSLTLGLCGAPGSGKTTLITRLLEYWRNRYHIGWLQSQPFDGIQVDLPGETTLVQWNTSVKASWPHGSTDLLLQRQLFQDCDWVLAEGWEQAPWPKLVFLDPAGEILAQARRGKLGEVLAFISPGAPPTELPAPCLARDDLHGISQLIETWLHRQHAAIPLYGLVLAGGLSQRMGQDKALLRYGTKTQLERSLELLVPFCQQVWVSCRPGQVWDIPGLQVLPDHILGYGPLGGILTAQLQAPHAAWLVLAVDLPLLNSQTLQVLIQGRNPFCFATCFQSSQDGLPEPLCAIYEPHFRARLFSFLGAGYRCPRKALLNSRIEMLPLPEPHCLDNANTPADFARLRALIQEMQP